VCECEYINTKSIEKRAHLHPHEPSDFPTSLLTKPNMAAAAENTTLPESTDFPLKRQREEEAEDQLPHNGVSQTVPKDPQPNGLSSVIPGWFSEISPMWPGSFSLATLLFLFSKIQSFCVPYSFISIKIEFLFLMKLRFNCCLLGHGFYVF